MNLFPKVDPSADEFASRVAARDRRLGKMGLAILLYSSVWVVTLALTVRGYPDAGTVGDWVVWLSFLLLPIAGVVCYTRQRLKRISGGHAR